MSEFHISLITNREIRSSEALQKAEEIQYKVDNEITEEKATRRAILNMTSREQRRKMNYTLSNKRSKTGKTWK
jgi:vacuolar-type H+-ATPase subunit E/Vma4